MWLGWKVLEACPAVSGGWGSPHPGNLEKRNLDFSLGSSFLNSPPAFISVQPFLPWAGSPDGVGPAFQEQNPALLPLPGKTGPRSVGTVPSAHHPETGLGGNRVGGEEGRAV